MLQGGKANFAVEIFVYFSSMVKDVNLKIGIHDSHVFSYDTIKALNIDSTSVSVMTICMGISIIL